MSKKRRDDHFIPQAVLRQWDDGSGKIFYARVRNGQIETGTAFATKKSKIELFHRPDHDQYFNTRTERIEDLNEYRRQFENKIKGRIDHLLNIITPNEKNLDADYNFINRKVPETDKLFWIRYYYLSALTNPYLQKFYEEWFKSLLLQSNPTKAVRMMLQAQNNFLSPSTIVDEFFVKYVLNFREVFITFIYSADPSKSFIVSDSYLPHEHFHYLNNGTRMHWVPLHPRLIFRIFYQQGVEGASKREKLQLRVFLEDPNIFNLEGLKYGSEIIGSLSQASFVCLNQKLMLGPKYLNIS